MIYMMYIIYIIYSFMIISYNL